MASINVFGWLGYEMEIDRHIKTRVFFAVVDSKRTRLAWYMFAQSLIPAWQVGFDRVLIGERKLDRNEVFGDAISHPTVNEDAGSDIGGLAPRLGPGHGNVAFLVMTDHVKTTTCLVRWLVDSRKHLTLKFDLRKAGKRTTSGVIFFAPSTWMKRGLVSLLGVEPFSVRALKRGVRGASALTGGVDPHSPGY